MRLLVMGAQGVFYNLYFLAYMLSPKTCHSFVGYLEEEAVRTYSHAIEDLRAGRLPEWKDKPAPALAIGEQNARTPIAFARPLDSLSLSQPMKQTSLLLTYTSQPPPVPQSTGSSAAAPRWRTCCWPCGRTSARTST